MGDAYLRFNSDLAGFDPKRYDGSIAGIVTAVMRWLLTRPEVVPPLVPTEVLAALPAFEDAMQKLKAAWGGDPPWPDIVMAAIHVARSLG
jgi:hypothetical protein